MKVATLVSLGYRLRLKPDGNIGIIPKLNDDELRELVRKNKPQLIDELKQLSPSGYYPPSTNGVYQIGSLSTGPGTELEKLIPKIFGLGVGCLKCKAKRDQMNAWGVKGCRERETELVNWLVSRGKGSILLKWFPKGLTTPVAEKLLDKAINNSLSRTYSSPVASDPNWFVLLTTAPRERATLPQSVRSLRRCGWEPDVFAEPNSLSTNCTTWENPTRLGVWYNWLYAAEFALTHNKTASCFLSVQDDVVFHPETKLMIDERISDYGDGMVCLYTSRHYNRHGERGIYRIHTRELWGACAIVFPRKILEKVLATQKVKTWCGATPKTKRRRRATYKKRRENPSMIANSDSAIGKAMAEIGAPIYFVAPSPASHIATISSIAHGSNKGSRNCGPCADHKIPLAKQMEL